MSDDRDWSDCTWGDLDVALSDPDILADTDREEPTTLPARLARVGAALGVLIQALWALLPKHPHKHTTRE